MAALCLSIGAAPTPLFRVKSKHVEQGVYKLLQLIERSVKQGRSQDRLPLLLASRQGL